MTECKLLMQSLRNLYARASQLDAVVDFCPNICDN